MNGKLSAVSIAAVLAGISCKSRPPMEPSPPEWLDTTVLEQARSAGDVEQLGDILKGTTRDEGKSISFNTQLEMNECYVFSVAGGQSVEEIKIYLFNPNGQRVMDKEQEARVMAQFCVNGQTTVSSWGWGASVATAMPGLYKIEIKTTEGYGHVALGVFAQNQAPAGPVGPTPAN